MPVNGLSNAATNGSQGLVQQSGMLYDFIGIFHVPWVYSSHHTHLMVYTHCRFLLSVNRSPQKAKQFSHGGRSCRSGTTGVVFLGGWWGLSCVKNLSCWHGANTPPSKNPSQWFQIDYRLFNSHQRTSCLPRLRFWWVSFLEMPREFNTLVTGAETWKLQTSKRLETFQKCMFHDWSLKKAGQPEALF